MISHNCLISVIKTAQNIVKLRRESDREENKDVRLIEFVAQSELSGFVIIADVVNELKIYYGEEEKWMNPKGVSRSLNRLKLILDKHSTGNLREVKLDLSKAKEKLLLFKDPIKKLENNPLPKLSQPKYCGREFLDNETSKFWICGQLWKEGQLKICPECLGGEK